MNELDTFRRFARSVSIAHHIPGRIRFKLGEIELDAAGKAALDSARRFQGLIETLAGVKSIKLNLLARSCTVEYDVKLIAPQAWPDLLAGTESPAALALIERVRSRLAEAGHA